jgi:hypothetical protein
MVRLLALALAAVLAVALPASADGASPDHPDPGTSDGASADGAPAPAGSCFGSIACLLLPWQDTAMATPHAFVPTAACSALALPAADVWAVDAAGCAAAQDSAVLIASPGAPVPTGACRVVTVNMAQPWASQVDPEGCWHDFVRHVIGWQAATLAESAPLVPLP